MAIREKKHRLPDTAYVGEVQVAFTMCVERREPLFANPQLVEIALDLLTFQVRRFGCTAPVYCFMPDHIHVILSGKTKFSKPKAAIDAFKCRWGEWLVVNKPQSDMQKDYHDHIIRKREDWKAQLFYVALNPVRAGLVNRIEDFPFTGSIDGDLEQSLRGAAY